MHIVIDMQGAQSDNSFGRYAGYPAALARAIVRNRRDHEISLLLNGLFQETIEPIRAAFAELLPQQKIVVWEAPGPIDYLSAPKWRVHAAESIREYAISYLKPDAVLVTSIFDDFGGGTVVSIGKTLCEFPTAVVFYDLVPFFHRLHQKPFRENSLIENFYVNRLSYLRRADLHLSASEASRQSAIEHLRFNEESVVNISAAAIGQFSSRKISPSRERAVRERYALERPFVVCVAGMEHANIVAMIRAYARLPDEISQRHQLAIVGTVLNDDRAHLVDLAQHHGLSTGDLVFTGFVGEDDLVDIYNLCKISVVPSWHDSIGLSALEAMSCGSPVIGARASSLPEVIDRDDALFDPHDDNDITAKLSQALTDEAFCRSLARHGLERAKQFSWDATAKRALVALQQCAEQSRRSEDGRRVASSTSVPKLAYISPLPPERSGISDYSAELLPALGRHYDIDVVVRQDVTDPQIADAFPIRTVEWFRNHADHYDRVLYHFGNSPFHQHMFELLEQVPGTIVLHDFFLSSVVTYLECYGLVPNAWTAELYTSHGYEAVWQRFHSSDSQTLWGNSKVGWRYPCNLSVLQRAQGVIVHSKYSLRLAEEWYGGSVRTNCAVIPFVRHKGVTRNKIAARQALGFSASDFLVCAFGQLGQVKLNQRLLQAWLNSGLARDRNCYLLFVGENQNDDYGQELLATIGRVSPEGNIRITGWVDTGAFHQYLAAGDIAVQLRTLSRGETSAAVFDCMNHGLATIVNAHATMAELDGDAVWKLPDEFTDAQLVEALETLWKDAELRRRLGGRGQEIIADKHNPLRCAALYHEAIERFSVTASASVARGLASDLASNHKLEERVLTEISSAVAQNMPRPFKARQLLVDISAVVLRDLRTGIQRVVRGIIHELLTTPPSGFRVEPVYATKYGGYRYARQFTLDFLDCPRDVLDDELAEFSAGDILIILDYYTIVAEKNRSFYQLLRRRGVQVIFLVHDLLPVVMPQHFREEDSEAHARWLQIAAESDGAICVTKAVADELSRWIEQNGPTRHRPFKIAWSHSGADINSARTMGLPPDGQAVLDRIRSRASFLLVGTLEPRKGHSQVLQAFSELWQAGVNVNLVIVGQRGWMVGNLLKDLHGHPELNKRLFWLESISDEYLDEIYAACTCLIAASEGEGFGLPLIEAARHKLPIIARDIAVFREVADGHAFYFAGREPTSLASSITEWLALYAVGQHPKSEAVPWITWKQSARRLLEILLKDDWYIAVSSKRRRIPTGDRALSEATGQVVPKERPLRQLLLDVSETCRTELKTGIERVTRALVLAFLENPPIGFRVKPVYLAEAGGLWHYRAARRFTRDLLGHPSDESNDPLVKPQAGDVLLVLDNSGDRVISAEATGLYTYYRNRGVAVYFTVYDLLPVRMPQYFPPGADHNFEKWLGVLLKMDGAVCISQTVADDFCNWAPSNDASRQSPFHVGWFHLGADIDNAAPTRGLPDDASHNLSALMARPSFLMVGTIEPRKGHQQVLDAFDRLWGQGQDVNLIIVGAEGWRTVPQDKRRTIPQLLARLQCHPERQRRLFWVNGPSDEYLEKIYAASCCLIAASEGEGFGLPLIEAARHGVPIIARDIPVFREVAGEHCFYFAGTEAAPLTTAIKEWLSLYHEGKHPKSEAVPWKTWKQSIERLKDILVRGRWYASLPCASHQDKALNPDLPRAIA
jgi:glycosyltransferase involved in cell wall biosynthesis